MTTYDARISSPTEILSGPLRPRGRLLDLERAKGLMMILVVLGHTYDPGEPGWSLVFRRLIYSFHMPFFMYLSGYLFVVTGAHVMKADFGGYVVKRARRLLIPFLVMAVVIISLKLVSEHYVTVNKPVSSGSAAFYSVFFNTRSSPVVTIWYLFVLFVYTATVPLLYRLCRGRWALLILLGSALHAYFVLSLSFGGLTDAFYLDRICWFLLYFLVGCWAASEQKRWVALVDRAWFAFFAVFVVLLPLMLWTEWRYLAVGLVSIPAIYGLIRSPLFVDNRFLAFIGEYTLAIYLLNTLFIGMVRGLFAKLLAPSQHMLLLYVITLPVALFSPILVRIVLKRIWLTRGVAAYMI